MFGDHQDETAATAKIRIKKALQAYRLEGLHPAFLALYVVESRLPLSIMRRKGRTRSARQVFWLPDPSTSRPFPQGASPQWMCQVSSPVTAAGPLPNCTGFPIEPNGTLLASIYGNPIALSRRDWEAKRAMNANRFLKSSGDCAIGYVFVTAAAQGANRPAPRAALTLPTLRRTSDCVESAVCIRGRTQPHMIKSKLKHIVREAARQAHVQGQLPSDAFPEVEIEEPKNEAHGDFSTNLAMIMARVQKMPPRKIAEILQARLQDAADWILKTDIAGPGFINFFIAPGAWGPVLEAIHAANDQYGASTMGQGRKVQVEFVSSNPTGPLHVGHGRGAAVGDSVARILAFSGYDVQREYYINDSGRQIRTLGLSVLLRYRALFGEAVDFPDTCYQGDYIVDMARDMKAQHGDGLMTQAKDDAITTCARYAAGLIIEGIRQDLVNFGVSFDQWFSEQSLYDSGRVDACIAALREKQQVYEKDGALWFKSTAFGDEKDRVVVRNNGITTYFASDIAYHQEKFERGFDTVIDVWGADHHGYIPRMKAAVAASGTNPDQFQVILVQLVNLLRSGEPVAMSTRAGEFVTLQDVVKEVGRDAARFLFLTRHYDSTLDFDLEVAKQKSNDNPVYYVQYVHARIASICRKAAIAVTDDETLDPNVLATLTTPEDVQMIKQLSRYPDIIAASARFREPHRVTFYLMTLAGAFHSYYNRQRVLTDDPMATKGRLYLVTAVQKVIRNGLALLGVSAPERM
mgnify:CR=1 FL=1